ncbi:ABC transporter permease subunit [Vulgatibacter incomptus]|uniref:PilI n=1 Tax=Vulgatibacter incomptus TaxID=1391653 RepID=A0A0K1PB11_9BACT|nr:ABC transporter permease subunit [Vulgatibacter incomptus]AKU90309.1 PilI [Vulgatibacter incomptus]
MTQLRALLAIARVTVHESLRDRILYGVLAFGIGLILLSAVLSNVTLGWPVRIVTDLSISAISIGGAAMAILLGVRAVAGEVERRLAYPVLARPISRAQYVVGKYVGVVGTVYLNVALMAVAATAMIASYSHDGAFQYTGAAYLATLALLLLKLALIAAIAVFFSAFTSSTVAFIASTGLTLAGHLTGELRFFLGKSESALTRALGDGLYYTLPDFVTLEALSKLVHEQEILTSHTLAATAYGTCYLAALLVLTSMVFERRDLP